MSKTDLKPDVVVIGGGPGGTTAATMLARQGARVLLLERERFPRDHIGESLLPASMPVLEELGVMPALQGAGFLPKWGATMVWGKERAPWSWYFKETNQKYPHSYQVWRPQFDQLLLENSRSAGVDVREGHRVVEVLMEGGSAAGVTYLAEDGSRHTARAGFVVDASGQGGLLSQKLGLRRWDSFFRNLAAYGYFEGARRIPPPDETNIFIESYAHGWFWTIPLHTGWTSVGAVVDSAKSQDAIRRRGAHSFLMEQLAQAPQTARMLRDARLAAGPFVIKDWSYVCEGLVGDGYILAGDAACFVDPLFSSGVHLALMAGVLAAAYVTTALKDANMREPAGVEYEALYLKEYNQFREMARLFYSSNLVADSYFWEARRLLNGSGGYSPRHTFIRAVAGQPPVGYERAVLDRGQAPDEFIASVRQVESEHANRRSRLESLCNDQDLRKTRLYQAVPRLAPGVRPVRKPVLGEGEFVWGHAIKTEGHPEGAPCSALVAGLVSIIDGNTPVAELLARLRRDAGRDLGEHVEDGALKALQILYVEGAVSDLHTE